MIDLLNNNQGVIAVIGFFIIIPLTLISEKIMQYFKSRNYRIELKQLLLKELWLNMNYVYQIERSYCNQLNDLNNLHIPHYPPRINVIEKFINFDMLTSFNKFEKDVLIEIYEQLSDLKYEYTNWRQWLLKGYDFNEDYYKTFSSTIMSYIDPTMRNLIDLWIIIVKDIGSKSNIAQIKKINDIINKEIKKGKWIRGCYKSSYFNNDKFKNLEKFDIILCWEHDWEGTNKEVIEMKDELRIYDTWGY